MELFTALLSRKSCREYQDKQITQEQLNQILVAASVSPFGLPKVGLPHLTVVQNKEILHRLGALFGADKDIVYGAPTLILVSSPEMPMAGVDYATAGCVVENMALAATQLSLASIALLGVAIGLANDESLLKALQLPVGYHPVFALAIGYGQEEVTLCKKAEIKLGVTMI